MQGSHYTYKLKILHSKQKGSKPIVRQVHRLKSKVSSITLLKASLIDEFADEVPNTLDFDLGWFEGSAKKWLVVPEDLNTMYSSCTGNEVSLWCDIEDTHGARKRKSSESGGSRRQEKEEEVESTYQELLKKHGTDIYKKPQLKLWARMIVCGTHDDYSEPPRVPLITGTAPKRQKTDLSDAFTDAARAVAKAFSPPINSNSVSVGISPGKTVELRSKNLQQLRDLQQLYDDRILSAAEFAEQKSMVLEALRKLN